MKRQNKFTKAYSLFSDTLVNVCSFQNTLLKLNNLLFMWQLFLLVVQYLQIILNMFLWFAVLYKPLLWPSCCANHHLKVYKLQKKQLYKVWWPSSHSCLVTSNHQLEIVKTNQYYFILNWNREGVGSLV